MPGLHNTTISELADWRQDLAAQAEGSVLLQLELIHSYACHCLMVEPGTGCTVYLGYHREPLAFDSLETDPEMGSLPVDPETGVHFYVTVRPQHNDAYQIHRWGPEGQPQHARLEETALGWRSDLQKAQDHEKISEWFASLLTRQVYFPRL